MNFVSTPWKINIPLGKSVGDHIYIYRGRGGWWVGYYNFPRSTNKIKSFDEISTSEKNYIFLHFSVVGEGQILGTGMENQIFILRTPAAIKFFHQILKSCHFGVKKKSLSMQMDLYEPYKIPHTIS